METFQGEQAPPLGELEPTIEPHGDVSTDTKLDVDALAKEKNC